jgi:type IV pilus assembly protein PilV
MQGAAQPMLNTSSRSRLARARGSRGVALLEALVAMLVFSVGVLGLIGAQSATVKDAGGAQYRGLAAAAASDLISSMWMSDRTATTLQASFGSTSAGAGYTAWKSRVVASGLPNATTYPPTVTFTTVNASSVATIKVFWRAPGDTDSHTYTAMAQLQ